MLAFWGSQILDYLPQDDSIRVQKYLLLFLSYKSSSEITSSYCNSTAIHLFYGYNHLYRTIKPLVSRPEIYPVLRPDASIISKANASPLQALATLHLLILVLPYDFAPTCITAQSNADRYAT